MISTPDVLQEKVSGAEPCSLMMATVGNYSSSLGATLIFDGSTEATTKRYKRLSTYTPTAGARVIVAKISGSHVILGAVI